MGWRWRGCGAWSPAPGTLEKVGLRSPVRGTQRRAGPRHGYALQAEGRRIGQVTSGTFGPWIRKSIGMGYVERAYAPPGTPLQVEIRGRLEDARVVKLPFYRRS